MIWRKFYAECTSYYHRLIIWDILSLSTVDQASFVCRSSSWRSWPSFWQILDGLATECVWYKVAWCFFYLEKLVILYSTLAVCHYNLWRAPSLFMQSMKPKARSLSVFLFIFTSAQYLEHISIHSILASYSWFLRCVMTHRSNSFIYLLPFATKMFAPCACFFCSTYLLKMCVLREVF